MLQHGVQGLVAALATRHSDKIGELVANTVREWSPAQMVETSNGKSGKICNLFESMERSSAGLWDCSYTPWRS